MPRRIWQLLALNGPPGMSVQCPLSGVKQTSRRKAATSAFDPGCVKTHLAKGRAELFSQLPLPTAPIGAIGFQSDEIEIEILRASSA